MKWSKLVYMPNKVKGWLLLFIKSLKSKIVIYLFILSPSILAWR